ncbi:unnamed protein product [Periconia digitata]|uniref:EthD domain-containing protein n=1 Tax=Periconia digitata TaxID=1303443 RepID=A0A9W4XIC2_9PLEO|nr:unnamed protein product [Periconia digitata]
MESLSNLSALTVTETTHVTSSSPTESQPSENGTAHSQAEPTPARPARNMEVRRGANTEDIPQSEANNAIIILFCKQKEISFLEFKKRLEEDWVPCLERVCGPLFPLTYIRRYIAHKDNDKIRAQDGSLGLPSLMIGREEDLLFDCLVEATFEDNLHMLQWFNLVNEEGPAAELIECEATFSDINKLKIIVMENRVTINKTRRLKSWE